MTILKAIQFISLILFDSGFVVIMILFSMIMIGMISKLQHDLIFFHLSILF